MLSLRHGRYGSRTELGRPLGRPTPLLDDVFAGDELEPSVIARTICFVFNAVPASRTGLVATHTPSDAKRAAAAAGDSNHGQDFHKALESRGRVLLNERLRLEELPQMKSHTA